MRVISGDSENSPAVQERAHSWTNMVCWSRARWRRPAADVCCCLVLFCRGPQTDNTTFMTSILIILFFLENHRIWNRVIWWNYGRRILKTILIATPPHPSQYFNCNLALIIFLRSSFHLLKKHKQKWIFTVLQLTNDRFMLQKCFGPVGYAYVKIKANESWMNTKRLFIHLL